MMTSGARCAFLAAISLTRLTASGRGEGEGEEVGEEMGEPTGDCAISGGWAEEDAGTGWGARGEGAELTNESSEELSCEPTSERCAMMSGSMRALKRSEHFSGEQKRCTASQQPRDLLVVCSTSDARRWFGDRDAFIQWHETGRRDKTEMNEKTCNAPCGKSATWCVPPRERACALLRCLPRFKGSQNGRLPASCSCLCVLLYHKLCP